MDYTSIPKDGKRENEHANLRAAVQGRRHNVIVPVEQLRMPLPKPELGAKTEDKVHENRGIHSRDKPSKIPQDYGRVDEGPEAMREESVGDVKGQRNGEADQE